MTKTPFTLLFQVQSSAVFKIFTFLWFLFPFFLLLKKLLKKLFLSFTFVFLSLTSIFLRCHCLSFVASISWISYTHLQVSVTQCQCELASRQPSQLSQNLYRKCSSSLCRCSQCQLSLCSDIEFVEMRTDSEC